MEASEHSEVALVQLASRNAPNHEIFPTTCRKKARHFSNIHHLIEILFSAQLKPILLAIRVRVIEVMLGLHSSDSALFT